MLFCTGENVVRGYYIYVCYMSVYVRSVHAPLITESLLWYIVSGRIYFSTGCFHMMITQFDIQIFLSQLMEVFDSVYDTNFGKSWGVTYVQIKESVEQNSDFLIIVNLLLKLPVLIEYFSSCNVHLPGNAHEHKIT